MYWAVSPFAHSFTTALVDRLAEEYGLELVYNKKFHQVYEEASQETDFNQLLYRMNVISEDGHLSGDEWEAASKCLESYSFPFLSSHYEPTSLGTHAYIDFILDNQ